MNRKAEPSQTIADLIPDQESSAITVAVRAIDRLLGVESKARVLRYLNDRYGWTLNRSQTKEGQPES